VALAGAAVVVCLAAGLDWRVTLVALAACLVVGLGHAGRIGLALGRRRRAADRLLRTGVRVHPRSELLTWRAAELTSDRNRKALADSLARIVRQVERPVTASAVPLNRNGLRPHLALLRSLAQRLVEPDRPATPWGMLLVEDLLTDGLTSPLYLGGRAEDVPGTIERCLSALDGGESWERPVARLPRADRDDLTSRRGRGTRVRSGGGLS
jgi:hypothetical protein